jgi:uncharacterized protein YdhG (YjbR/CyaY superfamily)
MAKSSPTPQTVAAFINSLPDEQRFVVKKVRTLIRKHLPKGYEEAVSKGALVYQVPLRVYPDTYNKHPLWYAGLTMGRSGFSLHLVALYGSATLTKRLEEGFAAAGKKLDMGKACIRFKRIEELPLDVIGDIVSAVPMDKWIAIAQAARRR